MASSLQQVNRTKVPDLTYTFRPDKIIAASRISTFRTFRRCIFYSVIEPIKRIEQTDQIKKADHK